MDVHFVPPDLRRLDQLKSEALSVPIFSDERPPRGALGLVDWRLCGRISRLIQRGQLTGERGETVLVPARPRLTFEKLFVYGVGRREDFDLELYDATVERMLATLTRARVRASVLVLPGRPHQLLGPVEAMERFLGVANRHSEHDDVTLVEDAESQKTMEPVVESERRRARARSSA
jgi:hypothetical protein